MATNYMNMSNLSKQKGLSLIELMISLVVGLFLIAGLITSFITTKNSDRTRNAVSEMDANASFIFETMRKSISHAGYVSIDPVIQGVSGFHTSGDVEAAVQKILLPLFHWLIILAKMEIHLVLVMQTWIRKHLFILIVRVAV